jgi:hypothetical protein
MSVVGTQSGSLRMRQAESSRLAWAFVISLAVHLLVFGGYRAGRQYGVWQSLRWPAWVQSSKLLSEILRKKEPPLPPRAAQQEPPLMFLDVSPAQATVEPPKDAKYYSDKNSQAANPTADQETGVPKIAGTQNQIAKTEDIPREKTYPLQPVPPAQPQPPEPAVEELKPKPTQPQGDLAIAKPDPTPRKDEGTAEYSRPRTLAEARARLEDNRLPGEKMQQAGGVKHHLEMASLDARATLTGAYDWALVQAVSERWYALLDERKYVSDDRGKVVIRFSLHYDGTITGVSVATNTTSEVLAYVCVRAIEEPAPYAAWPSDMRHEISNGARDVTFTFIYN